MDLNGHFFLNRVPSIVKEETSDDVPLIQYKSPAELEKILDLDITKGVNDKELEQCVRKVLQYSVKTGQVMFRNQLYGGTDPYGLSGAWMSEAFNTSQYTFEVAPAFMLIEMRILRHILNLFGLPDGDGIFSPGGSMSIMYGLVAARYRAFPEVKAKGIRNLPEFVIFCSDDSHYSIKKAAHWLGLGTDNVRSIRTNGQGQIVVNELKAAIVEEKSLNRYPLIVYATAGTTVLGGIDDLEGVADVCEEFGIWMHVDACWGGSLMLSQKHRGKLKGIQRSDSMSWNPHKMAGAPLQCSVFLVKQKGLLHEANSAAARYLFQQDKYYDVSYDTGDKSVQCGRKIDAFKLWVMWKARGDSGLRLLADHVMDIAHYCFELVSSTPGFRLVTHYVQCPNVCFWYIPPFMRGKEENVPWWENIHKVTPKIKELLIKTSRLMIGYSPLHERKNFFRLVFTFHPELEEHHVREMLQAIQETGDQITEDML